MDYDNCANYKNYDFDMSERLSLKQYFHLQDLKCVYNVRLEKIDDKYHIVKWDETLKTPIKINRFTPQVFIDETEFHKN